MSIAIVMIIAVAAIHALLLWVEMFSWRERGRKFLRGPNLPDETFEHSVVLAKNVGLYNGFLAAGLIWTAINHQSEWAMNVALFFLSFIAIAGIFGGITANRKIIAVQTIPALAAAAAILLS